MRYLSIDLLRTVALFLMVIVHFCENLAGWLPPMTGFGAPLFAFLSGVSYRLWVNSREKRGDSDVEISKISIRRGLFLLGLGFVFNVFVWLPEDVFNWDVLNFIGCALLMLNGLRQIPLSITLVGCAIVFGVSPVAREIADYPAWWAEGYYDPDMTLSDVLTGFLVTGYFPLLPWVIYPAIGYVVSSWLFSGEPGEDRRLGRVALAGAGLLLLAGTVLAVRSGNPAWVPAGLPKAWTMFPPSMEYVTATLGFALVFFSAGQYLLDRRGNFSTERGLGLFCTTFSRHSLSIYVLHHVIHLWPLWIYGTLYGSEPTQYWRTATSMPVALGLAMAFLAGCYLLFRWMDRTDRHGIETWMRWICD